MVGRLCTRNAIPQTLGLRVLRAESTVVFGCDGDAEGTEVLTLLSERWLVRRSRADADQRIYSDPGERRWTIGHDARRKDGCVGAPWEESSETRTFGRNQPFRNDL